MFGFLKQEKPESLNNPVIEMRKPSRGYFWWVVGFISIIVILAVYIGFSK